MAQSSQRQDHDAAFVTSAAVQRSRDGTPSRVTLTACASNSSTATKYELTARVDGSSVAIKNVQRKHNELVHITELVRVVDAAEEYLRDLPFVQAVETVKSRFPEDDA